MTPSRPPTPPFAKPTLSIKHHMAHSWHHHLMRKRWIKWLFSLAAISFMLGVLLLIQEERESLAKDELLTQEILAQGNRATIEISQRLNRIKEVTQEMESLLQSSSLTDSKMRAMIKEKVMGTEGAFRGGVVFKRDRYDAAHPLYSPYFQKGAKNQAQQQLSDRYDYTLADDEKSNRPRTFWFHQPLAEGPMWLTPYYGTSAKSWISEYIRPFRSQYDQDFNNGYDGIIFLNLSLSGLSQIVAQLELAQSGFGFILTQDDRLTSYPESEPLGKDIKDLQDKNPFFKTILKQREKGPITSFTHPINHKECWLFFSPIPGTDDTLGILVWADELRAKSAIGEQTVSQKQFAYLLLLISAALLLACIRFPANRIQLGYRFSLLVSIILLICLIMLWNDKLNGDFSFYSKHQVYEKVNVDSLLLKQAQISKQAAPDTRKQIPIMIKIQALNLLDTSTIQVLGEIHLKGLTKTSEAPPIYFPLNTQTQWEKLEGQKGMQGWRFVAEIKQPFNYGSFPFDKEEIKIQIHGKSELAGQLLVPAFDQYPQMAPTHLPGLANNQLELSGWQIEQSYFNYQIEQGSKRLHLAYNLVVTRDITGPIITHLLPLMMVSSLAFCTLLLWSKDESKITLWGFSSSTVLEQCAALFFILVISHVSLRDELDAKGMIFLEYFYFGTYAQIVFVAVAAIIYTSDIKAKWLDFKEGLIIKMLYWPTCLLFCLITTLSQLH